MNILATVTCSRRNILTLKIILLHVSLQFFCNNFSLNSVTVEFSYSFYSSVANDFSFVLLRKLMQALQISHAKKLSNFILQSGNQAVDTVGFSWYDSRWRGYITAQSSREPCKKLHVCWLYHMLSGGVHSRQNLQRRTWYRESVSRNVLASSGYLTTSFNALTLLVGWEEGHPA